MRCQKFTLLLFFIFLFNWSIGQSEFSNNQNNVHIADSLFFKNELTSAIKLYRETIFNSAEVGDSVNVVLSYKGICHSKRMMMEFSDLTEYRALFLKYVNIQNDDITRRANISYGMLLFTAKEYKAAKRHLDSIVQVCPTEVLEGPVGAAMLSCLADAQNELEEYKDAKLNYLKSIDVYQNLDRKDEIARVQIHIGALERYTDGCEKAIETLRKVLYGRGVDDQLGNGVTLYNNMALCFFELGQHDSARVYYAKCTELARESKLQGIENVALQNFVYTLEDAEALAKQKAENRSLQRNIMILVAGFVLVLAIVIFIVFRGRLKQQRLLRQQETLLHEQQVNELLQEQEIASMNAEMDGMREERDRVAKDLHDRLGGMMGALRIQFDHVSESMGEKQPEINQKMEKATEMLNESVGEIRKVAHNMASAAISEFGFEKAVAKLVERLAGSSELSISFIPSGDDYKFKPGVEMELYKIIQELISNILKHAKANDVHIESSIHDGVLQLIVEDDGIGFNASKSSNGLGINSLKQRVDKLKGKLIYDSSPGKGTTVIVEVPI